MEWSCACGKFAAEVETRKSTRAVCYCASCRGFVESLGKDEVLDPSGGNDLYQAAPEQITILRGAEHLATTKVSSKGPLRWFTTCCHTPVANTLATPSWPFVTLQTAWFATPTDLQPIGARVNRKGATGPVPNDAGGTGRLIREFLFRALKSRLSGGWKKNPFFATDGTPIAAPEPIRR